VAGIVSVWCKMVCMKLHSHSVSSSPVAPFHVVIHDIGKISTRNFKYSVGYLTKQWTLTASCRTWLKNWQLLG